MGPTTTWFEAHKADVQFRHLWFSTFILVSGLQQLAGTDYRNYSCNNDCSYQYSVLSINHV